LQFVNPKPDYLKRISELVDLNTIQNAGLAIGLDPMYGAASDYLKELIDGKNRLIQIHSERNPIFPGMKQPEPIGDNLIELSTLVKQEKLNVGWPTMVMAIAWELLTKKATLLISSKPLPCLPCTS